MSLPFDILEHIRSYLDDATTLDFIDVLYKAPHNWHYEKIYGEYKARYSHINEDTTKKILAKWIWEICTKIQLCNVPASFDDTEDIQFINLNLFIFIMLLFKFRHFNDNLSSC
jgi:hypothetical protein